MRRSRRKQSHPLFVVTLINLLIIFSANTSATNESVKPVDSTKWFHQTILPNGKSWFNGELQHYTDQITNSFVSNGTLKIKAIKESTKQQGVTKEFSSARLNSKFAFTYGKVEVRAKMPKSYGGTWPAIWMLSKNINERGAYFQQLGFGKSNWPDCGEIDILEFWGRIPEVAQSAVHTRSSHGNTINLGSQKIPSISSKFHVYHLDWNKDFLSFGVDNLEHYKYNPKVKNQMTWPFDSDQYLLLNFAIERNIEPSFENGILEIDYVRIYDDSGVLIWSDEFN